MQNNLLFELIPLIVFFVVYYLSKNIFLATSICIVICWLQVLLCKIWYKKISRNLWISTILITLFGGLSVILKNKVFIMLKPTVLYWILASVMLISQMMGKNLIKTAFKKDFHLSESIWHRLSIAWGLFFIALGALNMFIAFNFSEYTWVRFKVFGVLSLIVTFSILTGLFVYLSHKKSK